MDFACDTTLIDNKVAWPSGLRRLFKAPVSSEAWVRLPPLPIILSIQQTVSTDSKVAWLSGLQCSYASIHCTSTDLLR